MFGYALKPATNCRRTFSLPFVVKLDSFPNKIRQVRCSSDFHEEYALLFQVQHNKIETAPVTPVRLNGILRANKTPVPREKGTNDGFVEKFHCFFPIHARLNWSNAGGDS